MTYIIGEIGQNHNGSVSIAKLIIDLVNKPVRDDLFDLTLRGMDAVKLTKRDLKEELTKSKMNEPYNSPNSFGKTYGEHRAFLELSDKEHYDIYQYAKAHGLEFVETICSIGAMSVLKLFTPDYLKVASRDLTNLPLLNELAATKTPIIISTGMAGKKELDTALDTMTKHHEDITILHCVSEYPTHPDHVNLNSITYLKEHYNKYTIGYSDHTVGISAAIAAVAMGAKVIEKHITINRDIKGTDQKGSLGPDGVKRMVRDIRLLEKSMGTKDIFIEPGTAAAKVKLERSLALNKPMKKGETITLEDVHLLSPGDGIQWIDKDQAIGKKLVSDLEQDELIYPKYLA